MTRIRAIRRSARFIMVLALASTACGAQTLRRSTPDAAETTATSVTRIIATPSGPTPTPLVNGLQTTPTRGPTPTPYAAPAAIPGTGNARVIVQQFLEAVLAKKNIAAFLTPALRAQSSGEGYAVLGIPPPIQFYSVDGQQPGAAADTVTVLTTITDGSDAMTHLRFAMRQQGNTWLIDRVLS